MSLVEIAGLLLFIMLLLLAGGVWIAMTLAIVGWIGLSFFTNSPPGKNLFTAFWGSNASWTLAALPMFIWMGEILFRTRLSQSLFSGIAPWMGFLPGRLLHTTVLGCSMFAAISGSSAATTQVVGRITLGELLRRGYDKGIAVGSLAGAGTLGFGPTLGAIAVANGRRSVASARRWMTSPA